MAHGDELGKTRRWVILRTPLQTGVDDRPNAIDGQRRFRDIGRYHHTPLRRERTQGGVLFFCWQRAIERQNRSVGSARYLGGSPTNLTYAREENEHVARFGQRLLDNGGYR